MLSTIKALRPSLAVLLRVAGVAALLLTALPQTVEASNARAEVVVAIERVERKLKTTRWHFNNLAERDTLKAELALLHTLYDRILAHENELNAFPCAGAVLNGRGPPRSTEQTDQNGLLNQAVLQRPGRAGRPGANRKRGDVRSGRGPAGRPLAGFRRFVFLRAITDVEVKLLAQIVYLENRLATERWHFNNMSEYREVQQVLANSKDELRRVRNSRC